MGLAPEPSSAAAVVAMALAPGSAAYSGALPPARPARPKASELVSPRSKRAGGREEVEEEPSVLLAALQEVSWFKHLPREQLEMLAKRGRVEYCGRYHNLIREGGRGRYFYVLLSGQVHCTSQVKKGLSVRLSAPSCFGEGALITTVQREASVTALEPCRLLLLTSDDMAGLDVELSSVRAHVISLLLENVYFFRDLTRHQHEELAQCMQIAYQPAGTVVFEEDQPSDSMFVILEGSVHMVKRSAGDHHLATMTPTSGTWFGELALLNSKGAKRTCAAICAEKCRFLIVRSEHFAQFLEVVPSFHAMFVQQSAAYAQLEAMRRARADDDDVLNVGMTLAKFSSFFDGRPNSAGSSEVSSHLASDATLERWRLLAQSLLARDRVNAATEAQAPEEGEEREGATSPVHPMSAHKTRRVSYVAAGSRFAEAASAPKPAPMAATDEEPE